MYPGRAGSTAQPNGERAAAPVPIRFRRPVRAGQAGSLHGRSCSLDMNSDRFHTDTVEVEASHQLDEMSTIPAARVKNNLTRAHISAGLIEQRVWACWTEADIETPVHIPRRRAIHPSKAIEVLSWHVHQHAVRANSSPPSHPWVSSTRSSGSHTADGVGEGMMVAMRSMIVSR
jgi:hypothetical protein